MKGRLIQEIPATIGSEYSIFAFANEKIKIIPQRTINFTVVLCSCGT
jgi:hypothetical protein